MNVLFVNPVATLGGAERVLLQCLRELRNFPDIQTSLLTLDEGDLLNRAAELNVPATVAKAPRGLSEWGDSEARSAGRWKLIKGLFKSGLGAIPALVGYLGKLNEAIREAKPDLIHSCGIKTHLLMSRARPAGVPVVWHIHDFYGLRPLAARLLPLARRGVRAGIAISNAVANDFRRVVPGIWTPIIHNTIDCEQFSPGPARADDLDRLAGMAPMPSGGYRVGLVAAYARWKGHDVFLRTAAEISRSRPNLAIRWYIVGGPLYRTAAQFSLEELRETANRLGIADRVAFVPFQADPAFVYRSLDVVVHASVQAEPFGLTIAEAMACGKPVIVSRAGGAAELFEPDVEAIGVPPGDGKALSQAIVSLVADSSKCEALGLAARARAIQDFHPARLGPQLAAVYRRCLTARSTKSHAPPHQRDASPPDSKVREPRSP